MVETISKPMTAEEFARLPDDGMRRELVAGEVIEMTPGAVESGRISARLAARIATFAEQHGLGDAYTADPGFTLSRGPDTVRAPDVAFVAKERLPAEPQVEGFFEGAPDLAVEVVSPSDRPGGIEAKVIEYLRAGTRLVWVVYPKEHLVRVHRSLQESFVLGEDGVLTGDPVLPDLSIPVADIFAR